jgi:N-carbamoylputrescine amidase
VEDRLTFAGESFVVSPTGDLLARGKRLEEDLVLADLDLAECERSPARTLFLKDRRPEVYRRWDRGG